MYLITGATGFIGNALMERLISQGKSAVGVARKSTSKFPSLIEIADLQASTDWSLALTGIRIVVHTAARVHVMKDDISCPIAEYRRVNVMATINLAKQAAAAGVERFIFISSVKVNGDRTKIGCPFTESDEVNPSDAYGVSKHEAEEGLRLVAKDTGMDVVIIRPV